MASRRVIYSPVSSTMIQSQRLFNKQLLNKYSIASTTLTLNPNTNSHRYASVRYLARAKVTIDQAKVDSLAARLLSLNLLEINQVLRGMQARIEIPDKYFDQGPAHNFGSGGGGGGGGGAAAEVAEEVKEKEAFDLHLKGFDAKSKIKVIKEVRAATGLGLKEAKELVEKVPCMVKQGLTKEEAEALKTVLESNGGVVELL